MSQNGPNGSFFNREVNRNPEDHSFLFWLSNGTLQGQSPKLSQTCPQGPIWLTNTHIFIRCCHELHRFSHPKAYCRRFGGRCASCGLWERRYIFQTFSTGHKKRLVVQAEKTRLFGQKNMGQVCGPELGAKIRPENRPQKGEAPQWGFTLLRPIFGPQNGPSGRSFFRSISVVRE